MTIAETPFVLADAETSGVDEAADLLEIAARRFGADDAFETLVKPTKPIPPEASAIHHLVEADFVDAPDHASAVLELEVFVGDVRAVIVAHNAEFDRPRVAPALTAHRWLCSERLAHHLVPEAPNFKLGTLYYYLGGPKLMSALHRAAADLGPLEFVFGELLARYRAFAAKECAGDAARLAKSEQVDSLLAFAARPYVILHWPMGPDNARGKLFSDLDTGLLKWSLSKVDGDLLWNVRRELARREGRAAA